MYTSRILKYLLIVSLVFLSSCIKDEMYGKKGSNKENFELLHKVIDESYCYFEYKNINWDSIKAIYQPRVTEDLDKYELFDLFVEMLDELKDGHVWIESDFNYRGYSDFYFDYPANFNFNILERNYLGKNYISLNGMYAQKINDIGYIYYPSFMNFISSRAIKEVISQMPDIKGLIFDVRCNTGGSIKLVDTIVSNFSSNTITACYFKYKEGPAHNDFTDFYPYVINAQKTQAYDGNIVVLTNRLVFSAANLFVSAMKSLPNVTVIGDKTGGGGGMPWSSELYNGWNVVCSRTPMFDKDKNHIEFGIEPDIYINFDKDSEYRDKDTIIEFAVDYLKKL